MTISFQNFYIKPIQKEDAAQITLFADTNKDRLQRFFSGTLAQNRSIALSTAFCNKKVAQFKSKEEFIFVVRLTETDKIIGLLYLKALDWKKKQGELAYCIHTEEEGKGYTSQLILALSQWAFTKLSLKTVQIIVHKTNMASIRVAKKCGYLWQRTLLKAHTPIGELPLDMELYEQTYERYIL